MIYDVPTGHTCKLSIHNLWFQLFRNSFQLSLITRIHYDHAKRLCGTTCSQCSRLASYPGLSRLLSLARLCVVSSPPAPQTLARSPRPFYPRIRGEKMWSGYETRLCARVCVHMHVCVINGMHQTLTPAGISPEQVLRRQGYVCRFWKSVL